ncbi:hypothetical protein TNCV_4380701 [Trichonephila clavipes]|nr:hypothetical protein TNCV_4380701 [Trichonephila clavipes]
MAFHALFQNIPKIVNGIYFWDSRWPIYCRKGRIMPIKPASSQPTLVGGTVVLLENSITVRIAEQHKWMGVVTQQHFAPNCIERGWYTYQRSQAAPRKDTLDHD